MESRYLERSPTRRRHCVASAVIVIAVRAAFQPLSAPHSEVGTLSWAQVPSGARICLSFPWSWGAKVPIDGFRWRGNCLPKCLRLKHICDREANYEPADALISLVPSEYSTGTWPLLFLICRIMCPWSREQSSPVPSYYEFSSGTTCLPSRRMFLAQ